MRYTAITCHFGNLFWIENLIKSLDGLESIETIIIGHSYTQQELDAGITEKLRNFHSKKVVIHEKVLPVDPARTHPSIRHSELLNTLLENLDAESQSSVLILDSDTMPLQKTWLDKIHHRLQEADAVLAISHVSKNETHPCFMAFRPGVTKKLRFQPKVLRLQIDNSIGEFRCETGSELPFDLTNQGYTVSLMKPKTLFKTFFHTYLDASFVHFGGQSFKSRAKSRSKNKGLFFRLSVVFKYDFQEFLAYQVSNGKSRFFISKSFLYLWFSCNKITRLVRYSVLPSKSTKDLRTF